MSSPNDTPPASSNRPLHSSGAPLNLRVGDLAKRGGAVFEIEPDAAARHQLAAELGLERLRKLRFQGRLEPMGKFDWLLTATLGATVVQPCVVTAQPVTTRIDTPVERRFLRDMPDVTEPETEIPEDDTQEPLPAILDLTAIMAEALSLALPDYPRAEGAEIDASLIDPAPEDERPNPFAALAGLRDKLSDRD